MIAYNFATPWSIGLYNHLFKIGARFAKDIVRFYNLWHLVENDHFVRANENTEVFFARHVVIYRVAQKKCAPLA